MFVILSIYAKHSRPSRDVINLTACSGRSIKNARHAVADIAAQLFSDYHHILLYRKFYIKCLQSSRTIGELY